jgi:DNA-binding response OmpR family regulator
MNAHILVVEDDATTRMSIVAILDSVGYDVAAAMNGEEAIALLQAAADSGRPFDVVVTDIRMGTVDGVEVLYAARKHIRPPEVIILTGYGTMDTSIAALRAGAYDYLIKPCKPDELLTYVTGAVERHHAELRREQAIRMISQAIGQLHEDDGPPPATSPEPPAANPEPAEARTTGRYLQIGELQIDTFRHTVSHNQQMIRLTPIEYDLLACLAHAEGRVMGYSEIVQQTHKHAADKTEAQGLLKTHIQNLRRKIGSDYIVSVRSTGYMLVDPAQEQVNPEEECALLPERH